MPSFFEDQGLSWSSLAVISQKGECNNTSHNIRNYSKINNKSKYKLEYAKRVEPSYYIGDDSVTTVQDIGRSSQADDLGST